LTILPLTLKVGSIGGVLSQFLELNGGGQGAFSRLIPVEIGASELTIGESGQNGGELLAVIAMGEVDRLVEENVIQGVFRG
jgi:hypothetical protein